MTPRKMAMNYIMGKICWGKNIGIGYPVFRQTQ